MDNLQDILYQFGLYRSRRIYWYIYTTVELAYQSPHLLEELTRDLYPAAAIRRERRHRTRHSGCHCPGLGRQSGVVQSAGLP